MEILVRHSEGCQPIHKGTTRKASCMRKHLKTATLLAAVLSLLACVAHAQVEQRSQYEVITKGLLGGPVQTYQFHSADIRVEVRNWIMGPGSAQAVPVAARTIVEVRGGAVLVSLNGQQKEYRPGDFFTVDAGAQLNLENRSDVVVMRAIAVHPAVRGRKGVR